MPIIANAPCLVCAHELPVKETGNGCLSWSCPWCDVTVYAKKGTESQRILRGLLTKLAPPPAGTAAGGDEISSTPVPPAAKKLPWMP